MVARRDGVMHVGSKHDPTGFEAHPTDMGRHWLLERFQTVFPNLAAEVVEARAGLGAETPDRNSSLVHCRDTTMSMCLYPARMAFCYPQ